jgi:hypothetical protein
VWSVRKLHQKCLASDIVILVQIRSDEIQSIRVSKMELMVGSDHSSYYTIPLRNSHDAVRLGCRRLLQDHVSCHLLSTAAVPPFLAPEYMAVIVQTFTSFNNDLFVRPSASALLIPSHQSICVQ